MECRRIELPKLSHTELIFTQWDFFKSYLARGLLRWLGGNESACRWRRTSSVLGLEWFKTPEMSPGAEIPTSYQPWTQMWFCQILLGRSYINTAIYVLSIRVNISCLQWCSKCSTEQPGLLGIGEFSSCVLMYVSFAIRVRVQAGHFLHEWVHVSNS